MSDLKPFWVSWWCEANQYGKFELHSPWWVSGEDADGRRAIVAAVMAKSEVDAIGCIFSCHDKVPKSLDWRFIEEKHPDWSPLSDRFRRAKWMKWPEQAQETN